MEKDAVDLMFEASSCLYNFPKLVLCLPAKDYSPYYFFSRYPLKTTKLWNLKNLLAPASWFAYFITIVIVIVSLKLSCYVGKRLGLSTITEEIALIPFREWGYKVYHKYSKFFLTECQLLNIVISLTVYFFQEVSHPTLCIMFGLFLVDLWCNLY